MGKESVQLFVNEQAPFSKEIVDFSQYDTFISHKGDDTTLGPVDIQMFQLLQKDDESGHHGQGQG